MQLKLSLRNVIRRPYTAQCFHSVCPGLVTEACEGLGQRHSPISIDKKTKAEGSGSLTKCSWLQVGSLRTSDSKGSALSARHVEENTSKCANIPQLEGGAQPAALGSQKDGLAGGGRWRGLQGPCAMGGEGRILSISPPLLPPTVKVQKTLEQ